MRTKQCASLRIHFLKLKAAAAMAQQLAALGSTLTLNCPVKRIVIKNGRACGIETEKGFFSCDQVVSTMPLTDVIDGSDAFSQEAKEASKQLSYRNTTLVYLCIDAKDVFRDNWIYVHDRRVR